MEKDTAKIHIKALFLIFLFFFSCSRDVEIKYVTDNLTRKERNRKKENVPEIVVHNFKDRCTKDGKLLWKLAADKAYIFSSIKRIRLFDIMLFYYKKDRSIDAFVSSDRGVIGVDDQDLSLFGNVVVKSRNDTILKTEELHWCDDIKKVFTDKFVYIKKNNGDIITGYGMIADIDLDKVIMKKVDMEGKFNDFENF